jgi:dipeptidyl aminopeptidase/acylaminoacyl peptidase
MPQSSAIGEFEGHGDIGDVGAPGSAEFDGVYTVSGSGGNMWFAEDAFHYVWKRVEGDVYLAADVAFLGEGTDPHRKACLAIRQTLDSDSACAYLAVHGDGLTSLQYRDAKGQTTHEVQSNVTRPTRVGIERRGAYVSAAVDGRPSGGSVRLDPSGPFYIGLAVCSHARGTVETATFSKVVAGTVVPGRTSLYSTLETIDIASANRQTVRVFKDHVEAPNWTADDHLIYNSGGLLYRIPVAGGSSDPIDTDFADRCNNDHGLSPDGTQIAISDHSETGQSLIYTLPIEGGEPVRITENGPSYWHGWSPDGKTLAYCAQRDGKFGIFTIPAEGGEETRLTTAESLDDGPDYSPDGQYIYFNSDRTGLMQIFRMRPDGCEPTQITIDGWGDWFPHNSPDGRWMVFLSYAPDVKGHPPDKDVMLRLMNLETGEISVLAKLFGGQGTINVPSWSPDSKRLAFVSYQYL